MFSMFMGFTLHFYSIFGTNLLTGGPARIAVFFCLFQCFEEKEYQTEAKRNETFGSVIFGTNAPPTRRTPYLVGPSGIHRRTSSSYIYTYTQAPLGEPSKKYFCHRNLLYPRDPILEPSPALCRRGNRPWRASTSTSLPLL